MNKHLLFLPLLFLFFCGSALAAEEPETPPPALPAPKKAVEIPGRYVLMLVKDVPPGPNSPLPALLDDEAVLNAVREAKKATGARQVQVAWYTPGVKPGQGILAVGEQTGDAEPVVKRPKNDEEAKAMEKFLAFPTTPAEISGEYLANEVVADEDFRGKPVVFTSVISEIAKGAFNNPYVFFPSSEGSFTGLTCYFQSKDPGLRKIRKGITVTVRGNVKGFLMQDVILDRCDVLEVPGEITPHQVGRTEPLAPEVSRQPQ